MRREDELSADALADPMTLQLPPDLALDVIESHDDSAIRAMRPHLLQRVQAGDVDFRVPLHVQQKPLRLRIGRVDGGSTAS